MSASRVFIIQRAQFYDKKRRGFVNKYDFSKAARFGELVFLLPPGNLCEDEIPKAVDLIKERLGTFKASDYLLLVGDPVAIAIVGTIVAKTTEDINLLKWDRLEMDYKPLKIKIGD